MINLTFSSPTAARRSRATQNALRALAPLMIVLASLLAGCNEHAPLRENSNAQNAVLTQSKMQELAPAEGTFTGKMVMKRKKSDVAYDCTIIFTREIQTVRSPTSPTETVDQPGLTASLEFAVFQGLTPGEFESIASNYQELIRPLGLSPRAASSAGNYSPTTRSLGFGYTVSGDSQPGDFGKISGRLSEDGTRFIGKWTARQLGRVGQFELVKQK